MVEIQYKIHDEFAVEFKQRFLVRRKVQKNIFAVNTWFFVPNLSLYTHLTLPTKA
mgnify:CR=1 FL=1